MSRNDWPFLNSVPRRHGQRFPRPSSRSQPPSSGRSQPSSKGYGAGPSGRNAHLNALNLHHQIRDDDANDAREDLATLQAKYRHNKRPSTTRSSQTIGGRLLQARKDEFAQVPKDEFTQEELDYLNHVTNHYPREEAKPSRRGRISDPRSRAPADEFTPQLHRLPHRYEVSEQNRLRDRVGGEARMSRALGEFASAAAQLRGTYRSSLHPPTRDMPPWARPSSSIYDLADDMPSWASDDDFTDEDEYLEQLHDQRRARELIHDPARGHERMMHELGAFAQGAARSWRGHAPPMPPYSCK